MGKNQSPKTLDVVFDSPAKYSLWAILLVLFAPAVVGVQLAVAVKDDSPEKQELIVSLLAVIVALLIVFGLVLPRSFQVLSDRSVRVVTVFGAKWKFSNATEAHRLQSMFSEWARPKFKFATAFDYAHRIVVRRSEGGWDILVSPVDADGFLLAVNRDENVLASENTVA